MTPTQIALVQQSFRRISPHSEIVGAMFYRNLFVLDPSLRPMFGDVKVQGRKLMTMLATVVAGLERLDQLLPVVKALGARHAGYGVEPEHYDTVAAALLQTLEQGLGPAFGEPVREAWTTAYSTLADVMIAAAQVPQKAAA
ncbi:MAG TPA: globin family protein [Allosphingosinicella sp.]|nr:globin family protein [Allosphingosinicella sp.]